jgi:hypothetical protein
MTTATKAYEIFHQADAAELAEYKQAFWHGKPGWYQWQLDHKGRPCEPVGPFETKAEAIRSAEAGQGAP